MLLDTIVLGTVTSTFPLLFVWGLEFVTPTSRLTQSPSLICWGALIVTLGSPASLDVVVSAKTLLTGEKRTKSKLKYEKSFFITSAFQSLFIVKLLRT